MTVVDVALSELNTGDAIGNHARHLRTLLEDMGARVRFVVERSNVPDQKVVKLSRWDHPGDLVILQHGIGSAVAQAIIDRRIPCVVNYHNVTPVEFVEPWDPTHTVGLFWGRVQTAHLAPLARRGIADSAYNAGDLDAVGFRDVRVAPVLWNGDLPSVNPESTAAPDPAAPLILFVGRLAPNKCQHDLIAAMSVLLQTVPTARLALVGGVSSEQYQRSLVALAKRLGVSERVEFVGRTSDAELADWYRRASVFACLSEHEGFCVPLVEAMSFGVPVVGYRAAAVGETIADAGIVLSDKSPDVVASALARVMTDEQTRAAMVVAGHRRAREYSLDASLAVMRRSLHDLLG
jgi:glycosyltransferase involved in cell wall biosynthesis